jgi:hypothetical protein
MMEKQGSKAQGKNRRVGFKDSGRPALLPVSSVKERKTGKLLCGGERFCLLEPYKVFKTTLRSWAI